MFCLGKFSNLSATGLPPGPREADLVGSGGARLRPQARVGDNRPTGRHLGGDMQAETEYSVLKVNCPAGAREAPLGDCDDADGGKCFV